MTVQAPFSHAYQLLLLALPGVWLLGRAVTFAVTRDLALRKVLPIGVALSLWILGVHVASLAARSLLVGLPAATLALAAAGVILEIARRRRPDPEPEVGRPPSPWLWISMAATALAVAPAALRYWFHDEVMWTGHLSMAAEMQNGVYPPRHLAFPEFPLRYHYGFDLITASLTALLHLPLDRGIDAGVILLWCASWCLLWALGERLIGRARAWLTPFLALFAGGVPLACEVPGSSVLYPALVDCRVGGGFSANAPVSSYFFQHPWSAGIPVAITAILLFTERAPRSARARLAALAAVLGILSLCEIVLFLTLVPSMVVAEAWYEDRVELRRAGWMLGAAGLASGLARLLGGFFASVPGLHHLPFELHAGFTDDVRSTMVWNAKTFGALLLLGLAGLATLRRARLLFGLLAAGSIVVVNAVRYVGTRDITKFATVAEIALGILGSAAIARLLPPPSRPRPAPARTTAAALLVGAATGWGCLFLLVFVLDLGDIPAAMRKGPEPLQPDDVAAMTFLRRRVRPGEVVFRRQPASLGYSQWGGLPHPWIDWMDWSFGLEPARLETRRRLMATTPRDPQGYRDERLRWFVLEPDDRALNEVADAWIQRRTARVAATFGPLRVVELDPR